VSNIELAWLAGFASYRAGAFEPFLAKYIRVAEYVIGLATGSIILLVGSSALHGQGGHLPWFYASPLLLLAFCVIYGVGFMVWLIYNYEEHQHGNPHTRFAYSLSLSLGFSSLACFCVGFASVLDEWMFALVFAAEAALAGIEGARLNS